MDDRSKLQIKSDILRRLMSELDTNTVKKMSPSADTTESESRSTNKLRDMSAMYVEAVEKSFNIKPSVKVATTENIVPVGEQQVDDITVLEGDRVLVKDQERAQQNGIYVVSKGNWKRALDSNTPETMGSNMFTYVDSGTLNGGEGFVTITPTFFELNKTAMKWSPFHEKKDNAGALNRGMGSALSSSSPTQLDAGLLIGVGDMGEF